MIGKTLFYLEDNQIVTSQIVATYLKDITPQESEVMFVTRSNVTIAEKDASFSIQELFSKLNEKYRKSQIKE